MKPENVSKSLAMTRKARVMVLESWGPFDDGFRSYILTKGSEEEIPLWLAVELEKRGIVKTLSLYTLEDLSRVFFQERERANVPGSLVKLDRDFYVKANYYIERLASSNRIEDLEAKKKSEVILSEIKKLRFRKIMNLALLKVNDPKVLDSLTYEELLTFYTIRDFLEPQEG
ncbi:MAG: hypothetical protein ACP5HQ_07135 [Thermoprotei archaeon]